MRDEYLIRQWDLHDIDKIRNTRITVVGAGAIGSFTVLSLAKLGFENITVYDDDVIEKENMNCQFYPLDSVGSKKVDALKKLVLDFTGVSINAIDQRVTSENCIMTDIIISCVDSMKARKIIFNAQASTFLLDARMAAEYCCMYRVDLLDRASRDNYEKSLHSDDDAVQERCTAKATMYTVLLISGQLSKAVLDIMNENKNAYINFDWDVKSNSIVGFKYNQLKVQQKSYTGSGRFA